MTLRLMLLTITFASSCSAYCQDQSEVSVVRPATELDDTSETGGAVLDSARRLVNEIEIKNAFLVGLVQEADGSAASNIAISVVRSMVLYDKARVQTEVARAVEVHRLELKAGLLRNVLRVVEYKDEVNRIEDLIDECAESIAELEMQADVLSDQQTEEAIALRNILGMRIQQQSSVASATMKAIDYVNGIKSQLEWLSTVDFRLSLLAEQGVVELDLVKSDLQSSELTIDSENLQQQTNDLKRVLALSDVESLDHEAVLTAEKKLSVRPANEESVEREVEKAIERLKNRSEQ